MWTIWNAPSDRDYYDQSGIWDDSEEPDDEPIPLDPASPDVVAAEERNPLGEDDDDTRIQPGRERRKRDAAA